VYGSKGNHRVKRFHYCVWSKQDAAGAVRNFFTPHKSCGKITQINTVFSNKTGYFSVFKYATFM
jgi:hypothetical protein